MANKSIKLKDNNYIDSTGVVHNRGLLSTLLNNILNEINKLKPVVLYNGDPTDNTVVLSDSSNNYTYIEIFFVCNGSNSSTKVYQPNGKTVSMSLDGERGATSWNFYCNGTVNINNKQISWVKNQFISANMDTPAGKVERSDWYNVKIVRVLGYKY